MRGPVVRRAPGGGRHRVFSGLSTTISVSLPAAVVISLDKAFAPNSGARMRMLRASLMNGLNACGFVADAEMDAAA